jgi:hypothetical protein
MMQDRYNNKVEVGDECVITKNNTLSKVRVYRETDWTIQLEVWDTNGYIKRTPVDYIQKSGYQTNLVKI